MDKTTTEELLEALISANDLQQFLKENSHRQTVIPLSEYLEKLLVLKQRKKADVIRDAQLDTIYGYQIFQGKKAPSRDKLLQLAFGFPLDLQETEKLLHVAGVGGLYAKQKRDSVLLFALTHGLSLMDANHLLEQEQEAPLL